jgi:hypothetical protein
MRNDTLKQREMEYAKQLKNRALDSGEIDLFAG